MALADTAKLIVQLSLDDKFSGPLRNANKQIAGMQGGLTQMSRGVGKVGSGLNTLGTRAAIAAVGGLTAVITTAASFEQAFAGVLKTTGATGKEAATMRNEFEQLARVTPVSFQDLAAIGEMGGALGIANEDLDEFTDLVARLGVSTDLTFESAATAIGQLRNVLHLNNEEMVGLADSVVALGNAGASTESQIIEITNRFAAAAQSAGVSVEATVALASTVASMGIEVEAGGSALSRIFNSVATNIGTSNDKAVAFADNLGLSLAEFRTAWDHDAAGVFQDLLKNLDKMDQFEAASFLKDLGITNTRDVNTLRLLSQGYEEYTRQLEVAEHAQGATRKESDAFFNTTAGKFEIFKNNLALTADTIGGKLLPIVNREMGEFVEWLNKAGTQRGIRKFANELSEGIEGFVAAVKNGELDGVLDGLKGAAAVAKTAFDAFQALPGPVRALALAAIVGNKVTGGAIGQIAGGLKDIFSGAIKLAFERGSPTNPMFVSVVGGGLGGPGGPGGGSNLSTILSGLLLAAGVGATVAGGTAAVGDVQSGDPDRQMQGLLDLMGGFPALIGRSVVDGLVAAGLLEPPKKPAPVDLIAGSAGVTNIVDKLKDADSGIASLDAQIADSRKNDTVQGHAVTAALTQQRDKLVAARQAIIDGDRRNYSGLQNSARQASSIAAADATRINSLRDSHNAALYELRQIKAKKTSVNVHTTVTTNVGVQFSTSAALVQLRRVTESGGNQQDFELVL